MISPAILATLLLQVTELGTARNDEAAEHSVRSATELSVDGPEPLIPEAAAAPLLALEKALRRPSILGNKVRAQHSLVFEAESLLILVHSALRESADTAESYRRARHVPWRNLFRIPARCPHGDRSLTEAEFERFLAAPLRNLLEERRSSAPVHGLLLTHSMPLRLEDGTLVDERLRHLFECEGVADDRWLGSREKLSCGDRDGEPLMVFRLPRDWQPPETMELAHPLWWPQCDEGEGVEESSGPLSASNYDLALLDDERSFSGSARVLVHRQASVSDGAGAPVIGGRSGECVVCFVAEDADDCVLRFASLYFEGLPCGAAAQRSVRGHGLGYILVGDPLVKARFERSIEPRIDAGNGIRTPSGRASELVVRGDHFTDPKDMAVLVSGLSIERFEVLDEQTLRLYLPPLSPGARDLHVVTSQGSATAARAIVTPPAIALVGHQARGLPIKLELYADPGDRFQLFVSSGLARQEIAPFGTLFLDPGAKFEMILSGQIATACDQLLGMLPDSFSDHFDSLYLQALVRPAQSDRKARLTNPLQLLLH